MEGPWIALGVSFAVTVLYWIFELWTWLAHGIGYKLELSTWITVIFWVVFAIYLYVDVRRVSERGAKKHNERMMSSLNGTGKYASKQRAHADSHGMFEGIYVSGSHSGPHH